MGEEDYPRDDEVAGQEPEQLAPETPEPEPEPEDTGGKALADALKTSFFFLRLVIIVLAAGYLLAGVFTVKPAEVRFKTRFGKLVRVGGKWVMLPGSGLHFRWPWEKVEVISTEEKVLNLERAFWTPGEGGGVRAVRSLDLRQDGYALTGDMNIVHLKLRARYSVPSDVEGAMAYRFGVEDSVEVLRRMIEASTCKVVGTMSVTDVLNRTNLFSGIEQELRKRLERFREGAGYPLGLDVVAVEAIETEKVKNPSEPGAVSAAFDRAQNAYSLRNTLEREGETEASRILNNASAEAAEIKAIARGYSERFVRTARADAERLKQLLPLYRQSPSMRRVLLDRFYARTIEDVMDNAPGSFVLHKSGGATERELRLMFNRQPPPQRAEQQGNR
jgi:regulator of protease activity HflC (stomatin/prohibitin superfamily)